MAQQTCRQPSGKNGKVTKCNCLAFLLDGDCAVELKRCTKYMVQFAKMRADEQKDQLREWTGFAGILDDVVKDRLSYALPASGLEEREGKKENSE